MSSAVVKIHLKFVFHVICDDITENTGCEPHGVTSTVWWPHLVEFTVAIMARRRKRIIYLYYYCSISGNIDNFVIK